MDNLSKKVAYLKGLAEGLDIKEGKEGKLLSAIIDVLNDMAAEIEDMSDYCDEVYNSISDLSDEVSEIEDDLYGNDDDFSFPDDDEDDENDDWLDDDSEYSFECPECGETIYIDLETLESDEEYIVCPNCKNKIELDFDSDCGIDPDCGSCGLCDEDED
ncbi:MAG: hypothetical protein LUG52_08900 [Clostridia bacterium]|nr:hypothetical protein [Clostridia bacterium]